jgi:hypothetical protein
MKIIVKLILFCFFCLYLFRTEQAQAIIREDCGIGGEWE